MSSPDWCVGYSIIYSVTVHRDKSAESQMNVLTGDRSLVADWQQTMPYCWTRTT